MLFTTHNILRQKQNSTEMTNMQKKSSSNEGPVQLRGKVYTFTREEVEDVWNYTLKNHGLNYNVDEDSEQNWIGTMGPYLNMLRCWGLRLQELRVEHTKMPVSRDGENTSTVNIDKMGLSPAHAIHLEGVTYPPERRASTSTSLGALTTVLSMLRTKGRYRKKWVNATLKTLSHVPEIADFIPLTESNSSAEYYKPATGLLGDILMITTSRQSQRGCPPMAMMSSHYKTLDIYYNTDNRVQELYNVLLLYKI